MVGKPPVWLCSLLALLTLGSCQGSSLNTPCDTGDASCTSDYNSMLQTPARTIPLAETRANTASTLSALDVPKPPASVAGASKEKVEAAADEPDLAHPWWVCMLVFFAFAFGILFVMVIILFLLQLLVQWQKRKQDQYLASLDEAAAKQQPKSRATTEPENDTTISAQEVATLMNGDHTRLDMLLRIANSDSPEAKVQELVEKTSQACKLKLSPQASKQTCTGLADLMRTAQEVHKKRIGDFNAKQTLQKAMRKVLFMVKVSRALRLPLQKDRHHEGDITCNEAHSDHIADKYSDGHKDSTKAYKDVRLGKSALQAYFASEKWLDHTAIGFVFLWSQTCALVYAMYLKHRFPRMYQFMGPWLLVSRGEAMAIIVLTMMMVLCLTRGFMTAIRRYVSWSTVLQTIADKHVLIHRYIGAMLVICAALHILGHVKGSIPAIIGETDSSKINQAFTYGTKIKFNFNTWHGALQCWPAVTGYGLVLILVAFWALSNERVRRYSFELFHYPHLILIGLWCVTLIAHGWRQWLGIGVPIALIAVAPVVLYYYVERLLAIRTGHDPSVKITHAIVKKRTVLMEIDTGTTGMHYTTGMYCMLKAPDVAEFQWHPFTIASGGGQRKFQVLFAIAGDWTKRLSELISEAQKASAPYPRICVRGGYGAPAEGMKDKKHIIMVGGGVGATPFLSFLSNICNSAKTGEKDQFDGVESAVFYWVSREPDDFVWVNEYTAMIASVPSLKERVSIRLCMTKALDTQATGDCSAAEVALFWMGVQIATTKHKSIELASELGAPTQFGRPNWQKEFSSHVAELTKKHKNKDVDVSVFACGNQMLVDSLETACSEVTGVTKASFRLFAEEF